MAKRKKTPSETVIGAGNGGIVPPPQHRFTEGNSASPGRPPNAGRTIREKVNDFVAQDLTQEALEKIARSKTKPAADRAAAIRLLRSIEDPDLADFAGLLRGENGLEDLRAMGINTRAVKKLKQRTRIVPTGDDTVEKVVEREIELHDRSGDDFDRVTNHTDGLPKARTETGINVILRTTDDRAAEATQAADRLRAILNPSAN